MKLVASEIKVSYVSNSNEEPSIHNSKDAYKCIMNHWNLDNIELLEETKILLLNQGNRVLGFHSLSKGGITSNVIDIRLVLSIALKCNAVGIILVHNHPSGNLIFSEPDKNLTRKLRTACEHLDLKLLDHLIISKNGYLSFEDEGCL